MFTLTVFPDGRLLLTTPDDMDADGARTVMALFQRWWEQKDPEKPLFLTGTQIQHAESLEVDLGEPELEGVEG